MSPQQQQSPEEYGTLVLELTWEGDGLGLVLSTQVEGVQTTLRKHHHPVDRTALQMVCDQVFHALLSAAHRGGTPFTPVDEVRRETRELIDLLLDSDTRSDLFSSQASCLLLRLDEDLTEVPWELLHDGEHFLMERFAIGRQVVTSGLSAKPSQMREPHPRMKVSILGGGERDLKGLSAEARGIRRALEPSPLQVSVNLEANLEAFKEALRQSEVVHFCGHARFDAINPENSFLILQDGQHLTVADVDRILAGTEKVPRLVFLNTCESGRLNGGASGFHQALTGFSQAFLYRGVGHVILTLSDLSDRSATRLGEAFYRYVGRGETIGESLRLARSDCGLQDPAAWNYLLYGWPNAALQGDPSHPAVFARQLPSAHNLSEQDMRRVDAYKAEEKTQLLTLVMIDFPGAAGEIPSGDKEQALEKVEHYRRTVREYMSEIRRMMEITCCGNLFFVATPKPSEAVRFALRLQNRLHKEFPSENARGRPRIAIHLGEVFLPAPEETDLWGEYAGDQVDLVGRILDIAVGGQILLTRAVFDNARAILKKEDLPEVGAVSWFDHGAYLFGGAGLPIGLCEAGETGMAPLTPPTDSEKGHRYHAPDQEPVLGWRPSVDHPIPGTGWVLTEKLGEGGFGEIWKGYHAARNETHVFKFCFRAEKVRSLKREVTLFRVLRKQIGDHPNIVQIHDVYFEEPPFYIEMEYVSGGNLADWCQKQGGVETIPVALRLELIAQVADALQAAHDAGVIHRDIKPSNILVVKDLDAPERIHIKLTDFGIGQLVSRELLLGVTDSGFTQTFSPSEVFTQSGSRLYMAPELLAGQPGSTRSDLYSLGVVLYQLLVGNLRKPLATDWHKEIKDPLLVEDLERCFGGDPLSRFPCASEFAQSLRNLEARRLTRAAAERSRLHESRKRHFLAALSAGIVFFIILAGSLGYGLLRERTARRETAQAYQTAEAELYVSSIKLAEQAIKEYHFQQAYDLLIKAPEAHRNWEWGHLLFLCNQDLMTLRTHNSTPNAIAFSPTGDWLASGNADGAVNIWSIKNGACIHQFQAHRGAIHTLKISPGGEMLATGGEDRSIRIWDTTLWRQVGALSDFNGDVNDIVFSQDGHLLAAGSADTTAHVYETNTWQTKAQVDQEGVPVFAVALSPDTQYLATTGSVPDSPDCQTHIWKVATGDLIQSLKHGANGVRAVAFSPDGKWLVTGGQEEVVQIWNWQAGIVVRSLSGFTRMITSIQFSKSGNCLAASSREGITRVWDTETWREKRLLTGHTGSINSVSFSPDEHLLASAGEDNTCRLWNVDPTIRDPFVFHQAGPVCVATISPDGNRIACCGPGNPLVCVRNVETGELLMEYEGYTLDLLCGDFSPDGHWFAAGGNDRMVRIWDSHSGDLLKTLSGPLTGVRTIMFSQDSQWLACGENNGLIHVWKTEDWSEISCWMGAEDELMDVAWSPDGKMLAIGQMSPEVTLWDPFSKHFLRTLSGHTDAIQSVLFSPDSHYLATASNDSTAILWDAHTGEHLVDYRGHSVFVICLAFSEDVNRLFTAGEDNTCKVWETQSGRELITLRGHTQPVHHLSYSPPSRLLASGSRDQTVRLWTAFPWHDSDYPGSEVETFSDRLEAYKRKFWITKYSWPNSINSVDPESHEPVSFKDVVIEQAVRSELQKPKGPISRLELRELRHLHLSGEQTDLHDLQYIPNLNFLQVNAEVVTSSEIAGLKQLRWLTVPKNTLKDLSSLNNLSHLNSLDLERSRIIDLSSLPPIPSLRRLILDQCSLRKIDPLARVANLEILIISSNHITDLSPLREMTQLRWLEGSFNDIESITPLCKLHNLTTLSLSQNYIEDITPLRDLTHLADLNLSVCKIKSIKPLETLTKLRRLIIDNNSLEDPQSICQFPALIELNLSKNQIADTGFLSRLTNLRILDLAQCGVNDPGFLVSHKYLRHIQLANNPLTFFTPPGQTNNLNFLGLKNTGISDLSPLLACHLPKNMELDLFKTPASRENLEQINELKARGIRVYGAAQ